jgi:hypothetical protein
MISSGTTIRGPSSNYETPLYNLSKTRGQLRSLSFLPSYNFINYDNHLYDRTRWYLKLQVMM